MPWSGFLSLAAERCAGKGSHSRRLRRGGSDKCGRVTKTRGQEGSVWEMTMCIMDGSVTSRPQHLERVMGLSQEGPEEG